MSISPRDAWPSRFAPVVIGLVFLFAASLAKPQEQDQNTLAEEAILSLPSNLDDNTLSPYFFVHSSDDGSDPMPLKQNAATIQINGVIAHVTLQQRYQNEGSETLEAIYLFPASTRAAVHGMTMTIGQRTIEAVIKKRKEAKETYEKALAEGRSASLLEQHRPNVFQMSVGNILPGDIIEVELRYTELIVPTESMYEFVLPTVVGPHYSGSLAGGVEEFENEWVENPLLHEGEGAPFQTDIDVQITSGIPISHIYSPSHDVDTQFTDKRRVQLECMEPKSAGNRDFIVRYSLADQHIETGLLTYRGETGNYFVAMVEPPPKPRPDQILPKEFVFVIDVSGSMHGFPLELSKELMGNILADLDGDDRFNILEFAGGSSVFAEKPVPATPRNVQRALQWVDSMQGGGGTELLPALKRTFSLPKSPGFSRSIVVATDGYVTVEDQAFALVKRNIGKSNLFAYGIGNSVNRFLIERLARAGAGEPMVVTDADEARREGRRFRRQVAAPLLTNIRLNTDQFDILDRSPERIPDLFAARPIVVFGKYRGGKRGSITLTGQSASGKWSKKLTVLRNAVPTSDGSLSYLYARNKIEQLSDKIALRPSKTTENKVTKLGLKYNLLTAYTSFVAVDTEIRADGKPIRTVRQPLPLPQGVSDLAVGQGRQMMYKMAGSSGILSSTGAARGFGSISGHGRGGGSLGGVPQAAPRIKYGSALVKGSLAKDVIRRIVHRQTSQVRACYEAELQKDAKLTGRIVVKFLIDGSGAVHTASIQSTTLYNPQVEQCLLKVVKGLQFPNPTGNGPVIVSYPFNFTPKGK